MQIQSLTVDNLGVFRGRHHLDFRPTRRPGESARNLTVVTGENGAGKSTLFRALGLALHGPLSLGNRVSRQAYNDFLLNRLHRRNDSDRSTTSNYGGVELSFSYVRSGRPTTIDIERRWTRNGKNVSEALAVYQDGQALELDPSDYQAYLTDLVPPGTEPLCFFDAEILSTLTLPERRGGALLGDTLRRLLGLDLVDRLQTDLTHYTTRRGSGAKMKKLRLEILKHQKSLEDLDALLMQLNESVESLDMERAELETALEHQEHRLAAEGGSYAARRPMLQERHIAVSGEIEAISEQLRELSAGLLPFALIPELCRTLAEKLTMEAKVQRQKIADEIVKERVNDMELALQGDEAWQDIDITPEARNTIAKRLVHLARQSGAGIVSDDHATVHRLAEPEHDRLRDWIIQALHSVPKQARHLGDDLRKLKKERRDIDQDLQRAPEEEVLAAIHAEISGLQESLDNSQRRQRDLSERQGALRFQREDRERQLQRADSDLREAQAGERQTDLAERSKIVLRSYQDAMTRQRLASLEASLVESFNAVCHKEHLLSSAQINPDTFEVRLKGVNGRLISIEDFSAGEQQLYALALLRALRLVSKRILPLAVDTPVARLDEVHRSRFIHHYVPQVSDQVILFATDVEMDKETLKQAEPYLARIYRLHHDEKNGETSIETGEMSANGHRTSISLDSPILKVKTHANL